MSVRNRSLEPNHHVGLGCFVTNDISSTLTDSCQQKQTYTSAQECNKPLGTYGSCDQFLSTAHGDIQYKGQCLDLKLSSNSSETVRTSVEKQENDPERNSIIEDSSDASSGRGTMARSDSVNKSLSAFKNAFKSSFSRRNRKGSATSRSLKSEVNDGKTSLDVDNYLDIVEPTSVTVTLGSSTLSSFFIGLKDTSTNCHESSESEISHSDCAITMPHISSRDGLPSSRKYSTTRISDGSLTSGHNDSTRDCSLHDSTTMSKKTSSSSLNSITKSSFLAKRADYFRSEGNWQNILEYIGTWSSKI